MKAYYLLSSGIDEIIIPETGQVYPVDSKRTFELFLNAKEGEEGEYDDWEADLFKELQTIDPDDVGAIEEWIFGENETNSSEGIIACRDDKTGELEIYNQYKWDLIVGKHEDI